MDGVWVDVLGVVAGIIVAASLSMSDPLRLRLLNGIGAALWIGYGVLLNPIAWPVVGFNIWILGADAYYYRKILRERAQAP